MPEPQYKTVDKFDRLTGALIGLPDVTKTKPTTIVTHIPLIGEAHTSGPVRTSAGRARA